MANENVVTISYNRRRFAIDIGTNSSLSVSGYKLLFFSSESGVDLLYKSELNSVDSLEIINSKKSGKNYAGFILPSSVNSFKDNTKYLFGFVSNKFLDQWKEENKDNPDKQNKFTWSDVTSKSGQLDLGYYEYGTFIQFIYSAAAPPTFDFNQCSIQCSDGAYYDNIKMIMDKTIFPAYHYYIKTQGLKGGGQSSSATLYGKIVLENGSNLDVIKTYEADLVPMSEGNNNFLRMSFKSQEEFIEYKNSFDTTKKVQFILGTSNGNGTAEVWIYPLTATPANESNTKLLVTAEELNPDYTEDKNNYYKDSKDYKFTVEMQSQFDIIKIWDSSKTSLTKEQLTELYSLTTNSEIKNYLSSAGLFSLTSNNTGDWTEDILKTLSFTRYGHLPAYNLATLKTSFEKLNEGTSDWYYRILGFVDSSNNVSFLKLDYNNIVPIPEVAEISVLDKEKTGKWQTLHLQTKYESRKGNPILNYSTIKLVDGSISGSYDSVSAKYEFTADEVKSNKAKITENGNYSAITIDPLGIEKIFDKSLLIERIDRTPPVKPSLFQETDIFQNIPFTVNFNNTYTQDPDAHIFYVVVDRSNDNGPMSVKDILASPNVIDWVN